MILAIAGPLIIAPQLMQWEDLFYENFAPNSTNGLKPSRETNPPWEFSLAEAF